MVSQGCSRSNTQASAGPMPASTAHKSHTVCPQTGHSISLCLGPSPGVKGAQCLAKVARGSSEIVSGKLPELMLKNAPSLRTPVQSPMGTQPRPAQLRLPHFPGPASHQPVAAGPAGSEPSCLLLWSRPRRRWDWWGSCLLLQAPGTERAVTQGETDAQGQGRAHGATCPTQPGAMLPACRSTGAPGGPPRSAPGSSLAPPPSHKGFGEELLLWLHSLQYYFHFFFYSEYVVK